MNERYAVDPEAPADSKDLKLLLGLMGVRTGRFIAAFPSDWGDMVIRHLGQKSPLERARVVELLSKKSDLKLLPFQGEYRRTKNWKENAQSQLRIGHDGLAAAISDQAAVPGWLELETVLYGDDIGLPEGVGAHVPANAESYARCAEPVFAFSPEVYLIDTYFTLARSDGTRDRHRTTVLEAFVRLAERSRVCERLVLILRELHILKTHGTRAAFDAALEEVREEARSNRIDLVAQLVEDPGHARYLFGIHGGLQFDHGFQQLQRGKTNHVHWLSGPELKPLLSHVGPVARR
jgi:hypothetical protein